MCVRVYVCVCVAQCIRAFMCAETYIPKKIKPLQKQVIISHYLNNTGSYCGAWLSFLVRKCNQVKQVFYKQTAEVCLLSNRDVNSMHARGGPFYTNVIFR